MQNDVKLICFDLNETLIEENTWENLNLAMGVTEEEDAKILRDFETGMTSYEEGQSRLEEIYRQRGKAKKETIVEVVEKCTFYEGAEDIIKYLKERKYELALISGSVDILTRKVAEVLGIPRYAANNSFIFDKNGNFLKIDALHEDADFKIEVVQEYCDQMNIAPSQVAAVGDGLNDVKLFQYTGRGITYRDRDIAKYAWKLIDKLEDLKAIF